MANDLDEKVINLRERQRDRRVERREDTQDHHRRRRTSANGAVRHEETPDFLDRFGHVIRLGNASLSEIEEHFEMVDGHAPETSNTSSRAIFDYFGFKKGEGRDRLLRKFDGNPLTGLEIFRQAYHLARFYGLTGSFESTPNNARRNLIAIANYVSTYGMQEADLFIEAAGVNIVSHLRDHKQVQIGGKMGWVPSKDMDTILKEAGLVALKSAIANSLLKRQGYNLKVVDGVPIYSR